VTIEVPKGGYGQMGPTVKTDFKLKKVTVDLSQV
jgi:hypothetical protein